MIKIEIRNRIKIGINVVDTGIIGQPLAAKLLQIVMDNLHYTQGIKKNTRHRVRRVFGVKSGFY